MKNIFNGASKKKIIISLITIVGVAAIAIGGTIAYFQDTETSVGNKFVAGKFNLKIDNTCEYNGKVCKDGLWGDTQEPCACTWSAKDLAGDLFFNLLDVKPGDNGEDTISLHVDNNDAWMCAQIDNLKSDDNGCEAPENLVDTTCGPGQGELKENLFFTVWKDTDCDNKLDPAIPGTPGIPGTPEIPPYCAGPEDQPCSVPDEETCNENGQYGCYWVPTQPAVSGTLGTPAIPAEQILVNNQSALAGYWPLADSTTGVGPIKGGNTTCLGVKWNVPLSTGNIIQTDSLIGDVKFTAVQSRNMDNFTCSSLIPTPTPNATPTSTPVDSDGDMIPDAQDTDDDNDGEVDTSDVSLLNPQICRDYDSDTCDDCSQNPTSSVSLLPWPAYSPSTINDGSDADSDGICDLGDPTPEGNPLLVINEFDYDQSGMDTAEFIEIKNNGNQTINLDNYEIHLINGTLTSPPYQVINLPNSNVLPGDYYVVCTNSITVPNCDLSVTPSMNLLQNGGIPVGDAIALYNTNTLFMVDTVAYSGNVAGYTEGTAAPTDNPALIQGLSRYPDGQDTNNNLSDFRLSCVTPGNTNVSYPDCNNPPQPDSDADGIFDGNDNCPANYNPGQENLDGDIYGDICDPDVEIPDGWTCHPSLYGNQQCDTGCGVPDIDCN